MSRCRWFYYIVLIFLCATIPSITFASDVMVHLSGDVVMWPPEGYLTAIDVNQDNKIALGFIEGVVKIIENSVETVSLDLSSLDDTWKDSAHNVKWNPVSTSNELLIQIYDVIIIWNYVTGKTRSIELGGVVDDARWNADGSQIATISVHSPGNALTKYYLAVINPDSLEVRGLQLYDKSIGGPAPKEPPAAFAWHPVRPETLTMGNLDGTVSFWHVDEHQIARLSSSLPMPQEANSLLRSVSWTSDGKHLCVGYESEIVLWDVISKQVDVVVANRKAWNDVTISPNGKLIAGNDLYGFVVINAETKTELLFLEMDPKLGVGVVAYAWDHDGSRLIYSENLFASTEVDLVVRATVDLLTPIPSSVP